MNAPDASFLAGWAAAIPVNTIGGAIALLESGTED